MKLEKMDGGYRLLVLKRKHPYPEMTWKKEWYKFAVRLYRDTYGLQFSVTLANKT